MSKITEDTAAPRFLAPLQKRTRNNAVTAQLTDLSRLTSGTVLRRAADSDPDRRLERETLVALVRGFLRAGNTADADKVLGILIDRVGAAIASKVSGWTTLTREDKIDAQQQMIVNLCEQVTDLGPGAEFWECNFTFCFQKRLITLWHSTTDRKVPTVSGVVQNSDGEEQDRLEQQPDPTDPFAEIELQSLTALVTGGNPKKQEAIFLRMSGFPEEEIARRLKVTTRTLRNWGAETRAAWNRRDQSEN